MARTLLPLHESIEISYALQMQLSDEQINTFIEAWKMDFGEILTFEDARAEASRLLEFFGQFSEGLARIRHRARETPAANNIV